VTNEFEHNVTAYRIDSTGALLPVAFSPFSAGAGPDSVTVNSTGQLAYVANCGSACAGVDGPRSVSAYTIDGVRGLSLVGDYPAGSGPVSVTVDPTSHFVYVANCGSACSSGQTGSDAGSWYSIEPSTGALTLMGEFPSGLGPASVTPDPSAPFAYVANFVSNTVTAYHIETTGALTPIGDFSAGVGPVSVTVDPTGSFLYVANAGSNDVSAYTIDGMGALTPIGAFPAGLGPRSVTVDPTSSFVYVANCGGGTCFGPGSVSAYTIDYSVSSMGGLTPVAGSPFVAGTGAVSVTVEPTASFVYAANEFSNDVSAYMIVGGGVLMPIGTFPAGSRPVSITTTAGPPVP
jgi:DNA-binding beta-propeller fold protein YncE